MNCVHVIIKYNFRSAVNVSLCLKFSHYVISLIPNSACQGSSSSDGMETFHPVPVSSCINEAAQLIPGDLGKESG